MSKIRLLPDHVANQIAAGEVVERPASVAKELVENAIDAGAKRITIDIEAGGRRLLKVSDDGDGMVRDDAVLAFERHATSKIAKSEDLSSISTLGFRGEALASIASVARVELTTKTEDAAAATRVVIEGGKMRDVKDAAHPRGTTLVVRDLFFNVPARRKFLRSEATESFHLTNLVTHYALAHPEIAFTLTNNGREILRAAAAKDLRERAYQVFGADFLDNLLEVGGGDARVARVTGFVSAPRDRRTSRDAQYLFVNGRFVRDRLIGRALSDGYRSILPHGVYPAALLFIETPLEEVDVNVHPAKTEVRFRRAAAVADSVREAVRSALASAGYVRAEQRDQSSCIDETEASNETVASMAATASQGINTANSASNDYQTEQEYDGGSRDGSPVLAESVQRSGARGNSPAGDGQRLDVTGGSLAVTEGVQPRIDFSSMPIQEGEYSGGDDGERFDFANKNDDQGPRRSDTARDLEAIMREAIADEPPVTEEAGGRQQEAGSRGQAAEWGSSPTVREGVQAGGVQAGVQLPPLNSAARFAREVSVESLSADIRPLGQLDESFIIATDNDGLLLIDQHVAHERVLFDKYRALESSRIPESQHLLIPETFDLTPAQAAIFDVIATELEAYGFELMRLSGRTVAIKAAPADLPAGEARNMLAELLDTVDAEKKGSARENLRDEIAASLACHAAIKVNMPLSAEKMRWLIDRLLKTSSPTTCPHGRPVILRLATRDILKSFHRL
ncbi:MAG TPA: DNA mismatch repair endonuclease MutL [Pyrinomonadaceae bacterium]|nr:DNA mismatch repair endonuclease MutL [Pyrinomonadaceae bacterium]